MDRAEGKIRLYSPSDGSLADILGRKGSGPDEFKDPSGIAFLQDSSLLISDLGNARVARYTPDRQYDTVFSTSDRLLADLHYLGGGTLLADPVVRDPADDFDLVDTGLRKTGVVHARHPLLLTVAYWRSSSITHAAVGQDEIYVANGLLYPLYRYTLSGAIADSFGTAPPSWRQASQPERGQFVGPNQMKEFQEWRRTFTTISGLGLYRDSLLLVAHQELGAAELDYEEATYRLDIYDTQGEQLAEDLLLPGHLLHAGEFVYLLTAELPGPWKIGRVQLRTPRSDED